MPAQPPPVDLANSLGPHEAGLLDDPLVFIAEEHDRIRNLCALIGYIAARPATHPEIIGQVAAFVRAELPRLIGDEGEDLLPLLQHRCEPEDEIARLRTRLDAEHDTALYLLPDALVALDGVREGDVPEAQMHLLRNFADHLHRHLIFETAILLPLARARLTADDLAALTLRMKARREGPARAKPG